MVAYKDFDISFIMENYQVQKGAKIRILQADEKVIDRLRRIANVLLLNASYIDNPGLLNVKMGIAIFFYHFSRYTTKKILEEYANEKKKGRGFALCSELYALSNQPLPGPFLSQEREVYWQR